MALILTAEELLEVAGGLEKDPAVDHEVRLKVDAAVCDVYDKYELLCVALEGLGKAAAEALSVKCDGATFDDGDLMVGFTPLRPGDPAPEILTRYDDGGDWEYEGEEK